MIFIVTVYIKAWFTSTFANAAPNHDLYFLKTLHDYAKINSVVSKVAIRKFSNHLWFLSTETAAMAFFDENVSIDVKEKMVAKIKSTEPRDEIDDKLPKRFMLQTDVSNILDKELDFFISPASMTFFERFEIDSSFFDIDVSKWNSDENYQFGSQIVKKLKCVNDVAERGIKMITEYNDKLTYNENQKQYVIKVIEQYQKTYSNINKSTVIKPFLT